MGYVTEVMLKKAFDKHTKEMKAWVRNEIKHEFQVQLAPIRAELVEIRETLSQIMINLDGIMKILAVHTAELAAIKNRLDRHEGWIKGIAEHVGYQLKVSEKRSVYKISRRTRRRSSIGRAAVS